MNERRKKLVVTLTKSLTFAIATILATLVLAGTIRNGSGSGEGYTALFDDATSLNKGDDVRMAGVKVGSVSSVEVGEVKGRRVAKVAFTVDDAAPLARDAKASLRFRNLVGQRYIALDPGRAGGDRLKAGHVFGLDATQPALDLTTLFNGFQPLFQLLDPKDVNTLSSQIVQVFQGEGPTVESLLSSTASLTSTLADRDQVIGELISNLSAVLKTVGDRSDQLDTTLVTLQQLVTGLSGDRDTLGSTIAGLGSLSTSVAGLLEEGRAPLKRSIKSLGDLSGVLDDNQAVIDRFLNTLPTKVERLGRTASYGSWINLYLCEIDYRQKKLPDTVYYGDTGVDITAERCEG